MATRKISENKLREFEHDLNFSEVFQATDLESAVCSYETELINKFNKHFPEVQKRVTDRLKVPWYDNRLKHQKQIVRNRERIWLKYAEPHQWTAYKTERNRYTQMIRKNKKDFLSLAVSKAKGDSKALYQLANNLTSHTVENPLPPDRSDEELSEEFGEFFLNKILTIRKAF